VPSSRAYAVSSLELPAVTAAAQAGGVLVVLATAFVVWCCFRAEVHSGLPAAAAFAGSLVFARLLNGWRSARRAPVRRLEVRPDGSIWLREAGNAEAFAVTVERGTRLLGPSVFLDLRVAYAQAPGRLHCWITPLDAPGRVMRQWSVVLPLCGRVACT
jgi:hypothetical protein